MAATRFQPKPTFWWRSILILLPLLVLAVFGVVFLRQDALLTRQDAVERAQAIANELLTQLSKEILSTNLDPRTPLMFEVDERGQLLFPPDYAGVPAPRVFDSAALSAEQKRYWGAIEGPGSLPESREAAIQDCRSFIHSDPPRDFAATATYALGVLLLDQGEYQGAREALSDVVQRYADAVGESGVRLGPLAQLKLLEGARASKFELPGQLTLDALASNIVSNPTALTPVILKQMEAMPGNGGRSFSNTTTGEFWNRDWRQQETVRRLYEAARPGLPTNFPFSLEPVRLSVAGASAGEIPDRSEFAGSSFSSGGSASPGLFWFRTARPISDPNASSAERFPNQNWLVVPVERSTEGRWFSCHSESELGSLLSARLQARAGQIPEYFGIELQVAGRPVRSFAPDLLIWRHVGWFSPKSPGGGTHKVYSDRVATEVLATAAESGGGTSWLKISVYLTSPTALFERQQARAFWFGLLILLSTLAALAGLFSAWRAFLQQRQLSELKSNFVSSVSHELRAPIASVRLMAESLERGKVQEPAKQSEYYRFIAQECRRLTALVENVLDFSRIEQGRKQYEFETTDLVALVRETVRLMEPYAEEKGVKLELQTFNIPHSTFNAEVDADGRAIQQALVNLIDNATKHSPKGETVKVGLEIPSAGRSVQTGTDRAGDGTGNWQPATCNLFVEDHGPGIPKEEHARIFERFYRRGSELRRETQGVGIGLSIVKHIVEAHGGRVRVESEVGKGSRFTIDLPLSKQPRMNTDEHGESPA